MIQYDEVLASAERRSEHITFDPGARLAYARMQIVGDLGIDWTLRLRLNGEYAVLKSECVNYSKRTPGIIVRKQSTVRTGRITTDRETLREMQTDNAALSNFVNEAITQVGLAVANDVFNTPLEIGQIDTTIGEALRDLFSCEPNFGKHLRLSGDLTVPWVCSPEYNEPNERPFRYATDLILRHRAKHDIPFRLFLPIPHPVSARERLDLLARRAALAGEIKDSVRYPYAGDILPLLYEGNIVS